MGRDVPEPPFLTVRQVANWLGLKKVDSVLALIHAGQLRAVNVASRPAGRPRWRISPASLDEFLDRRRAVPPEKVPTRRKQVAAKVTEYF